MSSITYTCLAKTGDLSTIIQESSRLKKLRLESLQNDPDSFLSTFAQEVNQSQDFWLNRRREPEAKHWVAVNTDGTETEWVAFLVIVDQSSQEADTRQETVALSPTIGHYLMGAVYVDSNWRRMDICTNLIQLATNWIAEDTYVKEFSSSYLNLNVREDNQAARRLYSRLGFDEVGREVITAEMEPEKQHRVVNMRLEIVPHAQKTTTGAKRSVWTFR